MERILLRCCVILSGWLACALLSSPAAEAAAVDFSCMSYEVNGKPQVTDRYKEYDVVLRNQCPGAVNWNLCIERLDPQTHEILESLNPSGHLEAAARSRVNLQIKPGTEEMPFRKRFQEFYVSAAYAIDTAPHAECVARSCEAPKTELRRKIRANTDAWEAAEHQLGEAIAKQCPKSGWAESEEGCEDKVRETYQVRIDELSLKDSVLRAQLDAVQPGRCTAYAGELVP